MQNYGMSNLFGPMATLSPKVLSPKETSEAEAPGSPISVPDQEPSPRGTKRKFPPSPPKGPWSMVEGAADFNGQEAQVKKLGSKNPYLQHARSDIAATFG